MACMKNANLLGFTLRVGLGRPHGSARVRRRISGPCAVRPPSLSPPPLRRYSTDPTVPLTTSAATTTAAVGDLNNSLFEYTSGRWLYDDVLQHAKRSHSFRVDELKRLAAASVDRNVDDIEHFEKMAEGRFYRCFLITMRDGFRLVARLPYDITDPKRYIIANEVATMGYLRARGLPIPKVYGYSPTMNNAANTEYIFTEFAEGVNLSRVWPDLNELAVSRLIEQIVELEAKTMSMRFPVGGGLYYTDDLKLPALITQSVPLSDEQFCVGPDMGKSWWFNPKVNHRHRNRTFADPEMMLVAPGAQQLRRAWSHTHSHPHRRIRREAYSYQKQSPSDRVVSLERYVTCAPSLAPRAPAQRAFHIRHPDLRLDDIFISDPQASEPRITAVIGWHHTSVLPMFLLAGIPSLLRDYGDPERPVLGRPRLPPNFDLLNPVQQRIEREALPRLQIQHHYVSATKKHVRPHFDALADPVGALRRRLFYRAAAPWDGESAPLTFDLMRAAKYWKALTGEDAADCPIVFDKEEVAAATQLNARLRAADETMATYQKLLGCGPDGWVPNDRYDAAKARAAQLKAEALAAADTVWERAEIDAHWPFDDTEQFVSLNDAAPASPQPDPPAAPDAAVP
ncbi:protein kinase subdomain-containing protein PKL/CAK/Fmp29 [Durotheca rogersii]|uniref:protein kinase subdomain-containing protein PKL/CAK/Fmp29 n=1 Tax=Durotheca rogersii TaxID=419775 RepID=UPI0022200D2E|nr:protein kinase subdomain-containing protein PKL/CAK/Fmp29 [Durotheca rogersii]KAI5860273.1 protein kinase subdomain-containing protein PKL/CAK/Fmp29 [Durotheca rogersii]